MRLGWGTRSPGSRLRLIHVRLRDEFGCFAMLLPARSAVSGPPLRGAEFQAYGFGRIQFIQVKENSEDASEGVRTGRRRCGWGFLSQQVAGALVQNSPGMGIAHGRDECAGRGTG